MIPSHDSGKQITVSRIPASILQRDGSILSGTANRVPPTISPKDRVSGVHGEAGWSLRSCSCWRPRQMPICSQWLPKVISGSARHLCLSRIPSQPRRTPVPGRCVGPKTGSSKMATRSTSVRAPDSNGAAETENGTSSVDRPVLSSPAKALRWRAGGTGAGADLNPDSNCAGFHHRPPGDGSPGYRPRSAEQRGRSPSRHSRSGVHPFFILTESGADSGCIPQ